MHITRTVSLRHGSASILVFALSLFLVSCKQENVATNPSSINPNDQTPVNSSIPKSLAPLVDPADNPTTAAKVELGRHLFYDKEMSVDHSTSCASCHDVSSGFSDSRALATSMGFDGQMGNRNAPSLANVAYNTSFTWDGRFGTLEKHAPGPIFNSVEMGNNFSQSAFDSIPSGYNSKPGNNDTNFLFKRLNGEPKALRKDINGKTYDDLRKAAWGPGADRFTLDMIAKSIAAFERTFISTRSDFDKYNNGDKEVLKYNASAIHGFQLFTDTKGANCVSCHSGYNFTDQSYHDNGIGINQQGDEGRFAITKLKSDVGKFKTPSLRNVALSAPYMHDGRYKTLEMVIRDNYLKGGKHNTANKDANIKPLTLSDEDIADLVAFLNTLTDYSFTADKAGRYANPWGN
ncbi:MAG: cytochrome c peroxidase [Bacteroidota bacterium]|nr:cytochrome c peroxidase [Bacteroidota bacterium]